MNLENALLLLVCVGLCGYLLFALLRPERF
jgi:K+-transporting ATPase KdpF subunit